MRNNNPSQIDDCQESRLFALHQSPVKLCSQWPEFATQVNISLVCADGKSTDGHAFQELERVSFHDFTVFEGAWLGFVRIDDHIMRPVSCYQ